MPCLAVSIAQMRKFQAVILIARIPFYCLTLAVPAWVMFASSPAPRWLVRAVLVAFLVNIALSVIGSVTERFHAARSLKASAVPPMQARKLEN